MELTRQQIANHKELIEGLEGYLLLVQEAEEHVSTHPDVAIEICKALIEGLCLKALSLVSEEYQQKRKIRTRCKNDLSYLTQYTFEQVYTNYVETKIHHSLSDLLVDAGKLSKFRLKASIALKNQMGELVGKISGLRNERGDISHGRIYPKTLESRPVLAKSILSITDGVCSFMIDELATLYQAKTKEDSKLVYQELSDFNDWLESTYQVTSVKIDFSKLLYQNAYDKYEELYYGEFLEREELVEYEAYWSNPVYVKETPEQSKEEKKAVGHEDETEDFWTPDRTMILEKHAQEMDMYPGDLRQILDEIYFTDKLPLKERVAEGLVYKPSLLERSRILSEKIEQIDSLAKLLQQIQ